MPTSEAHSPLHGSNLQPQLLKHLRCWAEKAICPHHGGHVMRLRGPGRGKSGRRCSAHYLASPAHMALHATDGRRQSVSQLFICRQHQGPPVKLAIPITNIAPDIGEAMSVVVAHMAAGEVIPPGDFPPWPTLPYLDLMCPAKRSLAPHSPLQRDASCRERSFHKGEPSGT
jgi:hypothetical protein